MLEARFLWGNRKLFNELRRRFAKDVVNDSGPQFVEAKLAERDQRHRRTTGVVPPLVFCDSEQWARSLARRPQIDEHLIVAAASLLRCVENPEDLVCAECMFVK